MITLSEYLDSSYFMKKYGVNAYCMTAYREKSSFDLVKDEKSKKWKYPKEAEEEISTFCKNFKRKREIDKSCVTISELEKILKVSEKRILDYIDKNKIEVIVIDMWRYIDKDLISSFKRDLKPSKRNRHNYCPICKRPLNDLGEGEKYCKPCNKYFLRSREISYGKDGSIRYK